MACRKIHRAYDQYEDMDNSEHCQNAQNELIFLNELSKSYEITKGQITDSGITSY